MRIDEIKLAVIMAKKKLNLTQVAELSGISRATLSLAKAGKRIKPETAAIIADALKCDVKELLED
ncbi:MAG: helix-turn-helix transcriptional regulator [Anaerotignum propionicum]|uniref:helix-turn-helix domain-containing protein n=1 Tax=Anaerotignum propionicum TaxID=28446 RepID=UPI002B1ECF01|nr:helix-turn-helix transcriptional regulator [Anaerotignum propionicum]MEA5058045.1 helix-turn-helix transcriptional regulator [Anaerotignum propionicum]